MSVLGRAMLLAARVRARQLERMGRDPREAQLKQLSHLLSKMGRTSFGRAHRLDRIDRSLPSLGNEGLRAFRAELPIHRYEDLAPWVERAFEGEKDVIWPGRIEYFARSSGTTSADKLLPITEDAIKQQKRGGFDPVAAYLAWSGDTTLFDGKAVFLGGSTTLEETDHGAKLGVNTGIMASRIPRFIQRQQRPSPPIRALKDWEARIEGLVQESLDDDVRLIAGTPSWFPALLERVLEVARERGRDVETVREIWPNLRLVTGGGINYEPYRPLVETLIGFPIQYVDVYNSTEAGIMGVQDRAHEGPMQLIPDAGVLYEFVPLSEWEDEDPTRLSMWEVEPGEVYVLVVSTLNGLMSYAIGDCLRFVETFPHRFLFEGRTAAFLNVHGEKVSQAQLEQALAEAASGLGVEIADFTVAADVSPGERRARHIWLVEAAGRVRPEPRELARRLDQALKESNGVYASHRMGRHGLQEPLVRLLAPGAFQAWMRERGRLGDQNKVPRVLLDPVDRDRLEARCITGARSRIEAPPHVSV